MKTTTFTELRKNAKLYFDAVEKGEKIRVYRHGKQIAEIIPVTNDTEVFSWKKTPHRLKIDGVSLSAAIIEERKGSN